MSEMKDKAKKAKQRIAAAAAAAKKVSDNLADKVAVPAKGYTPADKRTR